MKVNNKGFTLVELLIVVAIIGILAAIALPAYQNYTAKANVGAALAELATFRQQVVESLANKGSCPVDNANATSWAASKVLAGYVLKAAAAGTACLVLAKFAATGVSSKVVGKIIQLSGDLTAGGMFSWTCTTDAPSEVLPTSCSNVTTAPTYP